MESPALHPTPRWSAVIPEQFRAVGLALRREWALFLLGLGIFTLVAVLYELRETANARAPFSFDLSPETLFPMALLGLFAPLSVWKHELPSDRAYFWSMPLGRVRHSLVKVLVGWAWMMLVVGVYLLWSFAMAKATGGEIGISSYGVYEAGQFHPARSVMPGWQFVVPFTATTLAYLVGSIFVLGSDRPWIWMAGLWVVGFVLAASAEAAGLNQMQRGMERLVVGRYGLGTVLAGGHEVLRQGTSPTGERIWWSVPVTESGTWIAATLLWIALATAGVLWAASRRPGEKA